MATSTARRRTRAGHRGEATESAIRFPGQVVLVLQGGGALGAYQGGVYEAMHEAGAEPDWVIGTSIGAVNAALIAGNARENRLPRLREFWSRVESPVAASDVLRFYTGLTNVSVNLATLTRGVPAFFDPYWPAWSGVHVPLGAEAAGYYSPAPLRATLSELIEGRQIDARRMRLTVGAVNVRTGEMRYFDSRDEPVNLEHVIASCALPPAFPAVRVDGDPYWDGGVYSNTPLEVVLDDQPRRDSVMFAVHMWDAEGPAPQTLWQVLGREKEIRYASRSSSHIARQKQIHHLRHVIRELSKRIPAAERSDAEVRELESWGCGTTMHVVQLIAPRVDGEDHTKDIDFTAAGIRSRWRSGYDDARRMLDAAPWNMPVDAVEGVVIHDDPARATATVAQGVDGFAGRTR